MFETPVFNIDLSIQTAHMRCIFYIPPFKFISSRSLWMPSKDPRKLRFAPTYKWITMQSRIHKALEETVSYKRWNLFNLIVVPIRLAARRTVDAPLKSFCLTWKRFILNIRESKMFKWMILWDYSKPHVFRFNVYNGKNLLVTHSYFYINST